MYHFLWKNDSWFILAKNLDAHKVSTFNEETIKTTSHDKIEGK